MDYIYLTLSWRSLKALVCILNTFFNIYMLVFMLRFWDYSKKGVQFPKPLLLPHVGKSFLFYTSLEAGKCQRPSQERAFSIHEP